MCGQVCGQAVHELWADWCALRHGREGQILAVRNMQRVPTATVSFCTMKVFACCLSHCATQTNCPEGFGCHSHVLSGAQHSSTEQQATRFNMRRNSIEERRSCVAGVRALAVLAGLMTFLCCLMRSGRLLHAKCALSLPLLNCCRAEAAKKIGNLSERAKSRLRGKHDILPSSLAILPFEPAHHRRYSLQKPDDERCTW